MGEAAGPRGHSFRFAAFQQAYFWRVRFYFTRSPVVGIPDALLPVMNAIVFYAIYFKGEQHGYGVGHGGGFGGRDGEFPGVMGAMLAMTGIFGMAAYSVSKRLKELGIRIAVGAQPKEVLQAALGPAFKLLAIGSAAVVLLGILASRVLAFIVDQATPRDPLVLAGVVLAMALLGLLATWMPARRALSVDPSILLREE